jgi:hypothetical protein
MNTIHDTDLILYHYRDGLDEALSAQIAEALRQSPALRARYAALQATLQAADAQPLPLPDAGFEQRLWQRWEAGLQAADGAPRSAHAAASARADRRARGRAGPGRLLRFGGAALALTAALGLGFLLGRQPPAGVAPPQVVTKEESGNLSNRVLDAYVVAHLRETEGVVMTAVNSDNAALLAGNRELAAGLVESNRLYAQAARSAGNARLANFLKQLEPLLIELANPVPAGAIQDSDGLRDYVDKTDLLFQLRATQARIAPQAPTSI